MQNGPKWESGKDSGKYSPAGSATIYGFAVSKVFDRKIARVGKACREEGIAFISFAADSLGGEEGNMAWQRQIF